MEPPTAALLIVFAGAHALAWSRLVREHIARRREHIARDQAARRSRALRDVTTAPHTRPGRAE